MATATGRPALDVGRHRAELGEALLVDDLDEDVEDAAAGQADRERVLVADAVALQHRLPVGHHLLGQLVDRALDAATGHRTDGLARRPDQHRGTCLARRRLEGRHHGGQPRPNRRSPTRATASSSTSRIGDHLQGLLERGHAVAGDEVVNVRKRRHDSALHG